MFVNLTSVDVTFSIK